MPQQPGRRAPDLEQRVVAPGDDLGTGFVENHAIKLLAVAFDRGERVYPAA